MSEPETSEQAFDRRTQARFPADFGTPTWYAAHPEWVAQVRAVMRRGGYEIFVPGVDYDAPED